MNDPGEHQALVSTLAIALDADDFETVHGLLDADCVYEIGGERHVGPDAVVASYRSGSDLARRLFDDVGFEHEILGEIGEGVRVRYIDRLTIDDDIFIHSSEQDVTVDSERGILQIVDVPIDGERERLEAFMTRHSISRD